MSSKQLALLALFSALLSIGQVLFKLSAMSVRRGELLLSLATLPAFYAALAIYGLSTLLWIYILRDIPLSRAYPFTALAFVITPILSVIFFGDQLTFRYVAGVAALTVSLWLIATA
jgi:drug/metabolite transporter (DMT)-like permease